MKLGWQISSVRLTPSSMSQDIDKDKEAKAERAKTEGNKAFRAKDYDKALELNNIAIELDPEEVKQIHFTAIHFSILPSRMPMLPIGPIFT